jgi:LmbE family N-acetylglucosaminyl deacetylase
MTRVLVIAAHPDDEVLGAGATMARLAHEGAEVHVAIVTEGCTSQYPDRPDLIDLKRAQAQAALEILGGGTLHFGNLPDMQLDTVPLVRVNRFLEEVVREVAPDMVFTHHAQDLNRDHRIVHEASVVACRPDARHPVRALYAYDVLGVTNFGGVAPSFVPNVYFEGAGFLEAKVRALGAYDIEVRPFPHPRSPEAVEAQGRVYGALSGTMWAEAFQVIREAR